MKIRIALAKVVSGAAGSQPEDHGGQGCRQQKKFGRAGHKRCCVLSLRCRITLSIFPLRFAGELGAVRAGSAPENPPLKSGSARDLRETEKGMFGQPEAVETGEQVWQVGEST